MSYFHLSHEAGDLCQRLISCLSIFCLFLQLSALRVEAAPSTPAEVGLSLREYVQRVLDYNESIQVRMLQVEMARRGVKAERGVFEPELVGSAEHVENKRPNTVEEQRSLQGGPCPSDGTG